MFKHFPSVLRENFKSRVMIFMQIKQNILSILFNSLMNKGITVNKSQLS